MSSSDFSPRSKVVLVVDDEPVARTLVAGLLESCQGMELLFAEDGEKALSIVGQDRPDLVLTDLQMPAKDGLELVKELRANFPYVPSVLMTAHGSEDIAVEALQHGAMSYVKKQDLSARLVDTVTNMLAISQGTKEHEALLGCWRSTDFRFEIDNDSSVILPLVVHLQDYVRSMHALDENDRYQISVALQEALRNAIEHGNLELDSKLRSPDHGDAYYKLGFARRGESPYMDRRVTVHLTQTADEFRCSIRDEGPGFDIATASNYDPSDPENLQRPYGRGLFLIQSFMDEVTFNEAGNEIRMVRRRRNPTS